MNRRELLVGAALLVTGTAHAAAQDTTWRDSTGPEIRSANRSYRRTYKANTQRLTVYRGFNTALDARVTWLSSDMRDAIAAQRDFLLRPSPEDQTAFREHLFADGRDYVEFVVMIDSELPRGERLGDTDDGWKMALAADDEPLELVQIERVRRPNPLQRTLYPDLNLWSDFYAVRFRRGEREPRRLVLGFSSGYGRGDLIWE